MVTVERPVFQSKSDILFEKIIIEKKTEKKTCRNNGFKHVFTWAKIPKNMVLRKTILPNQIESFSDGLTRNKNGK